MHVPLVAYAEPIAAMLSILQHEFVANQRVGILGQDRIARLCQTILYQSDDKLEVDINANKPPYDVLISTTSLTSLPIKMIKPGGTLIIKQRIPIQTPIDLASLVNHRLTIKGVNYAPFQSALDYLTTHPTTVNPMIGSTYTLHQFKHAFAADAGQKNFIQPCAA